jgi:hypothetical protein
MTPYQPEYAEQLTREWVDTMVVGLNLCPFAAPVVRQNSLHFAVSDATEMVDAVQFFTAELERIADADPKEIATSLLIFPYTVADFYEYLMLLDECQWLLGRGGYEGTFQLASFHPGYLFDGPDPDDLSHWTNRSPFPTIHIIREDQMAAVLKHVEDPDAIPERNIELMESLGKEGLIARFPPLGEYY